MTEYMEHLENATASAYSSELRDPVVVSVGKSIFDAIDEARETPRPDVLFTEDGADFVDVQNDV